MTWNYHNGVFGGKLLQSELRVLSVLFDAEVSYFAVRHQHLYREGKYHLG